MENVLISACLLGTPCRYDGKGCLISKLSKLSKRFNLIPACAECLGGLPTPRNPSERVGDKVVSNKGKDVTREFFSGADKVVKLAKDSKCKFAILKEKSPSCGTHKIYDGSFTGKVIEGKGVLAEKLIESGIECFSDEEIDLVLERFRACFE